DSSRRRSDPDGMGYLRTRSAQARHAIAAHFLRGFDHVVEIGGHKLPITSFLTHHPQSVISIDPKTDPLELDHLNGRPCTVRHVATKYQNYEFDLAPYSYGLVLLGCSLKPLGDKPADDPVLLELVDNAGIVIVDFPVRHARSNMQVPTLVDRGTLREVCRFDMQFNDEECASTPYGERRLLVLEPHGSN